MPTFFSLVILVIVVVACLHFPAKAEKTENVPGAKPPMQSSESNPVNPLSRNEISNRLKALDRLSEEAAKRPPPPVAMCYKPMMRANDPVDYICPECGSKTSHGKDDLRGLENSRQSMKTLTGIKARLDERHYCASCNKNNEYTGLILEVTLPDSKTPTRTVISEIDLVNLNLFLTNEDWAPSETGPAAENIAQRIHQMLGIPNK